MPKFFKELEECIPALRRYAHSLVYQQDEADDLVQDSLERAIKNKSRWQHGTSLRAWLFTIQHNLFVNKIVKKNRQPEMISDTDHLKHNLEPYKTKTLLTDMDYCFSQLPEDQREVLLLVVVEGFSYKEVSEILNTPVGTVMSRLSRARKKLQVLMGNETLSRPKPLLRCVK